MRTFALPLRVTADGRIVRGDAVDELTQLFRVMVGSPRSAWSSAPWFGLQELFAEADVAREDQHQLADALNLALRQLGVSWASVDTVCTARGQAIGARHFDVVLRTVGTGALSPRVTLSA